MSIGDTHKPRATYRQVGFRATLMRVVGLLLGKINTIRPPFPNWRQPSRFLRHIDGGSCNDCEVELAMLASPIYDFERFGLHLEASPCHADVLLITGPFTRTMKAPTMAALEVMPSPCWVITVGRVALDDPERAEDDLYGDSYAVIPLPQELQPVALQIKQQADICSPAERTQPEPTENHLDEQWDVKHLLRRLPSSILQRIVPRVLWPRITAVQDRSASGKAERYSVYPASSDPPTPEDLLQALLQWQATRENALPQGEGNNH